MKREEVVHIKKIYISFLVICLLLPLFTSVKASAGGERVSIGVPTLNVRTGPGLSYPVLMQASKGEEYTVTGNDGDWYKIDTPQGEGWVAEWLVTEGDSSDSPAAPAASGLTGTANEDSINVRKAPSTDSERLGTLSTGEEVSITGSVQGWYEISYRGGTAWINEDYLSLSGMESGSSDGSDSSMTATVNVESLLVRDEASLNGGIVGKVTRGESYSILEESNEWYRIKLSNGEDGWVAGWFMKVAGEEAEEKTEGTSMSEGAPDSITILYDGTNLRTSPTVRQASWKGPAAVRPSMWWGHPVTGMRSGCLTEQARLWPTGLSRAKKAGHLLLRKHPADSKARPSSSIRDTAGVTVERQVSTAPMKKT
nr:SH3 domain-containing protein [Rossellomorea marisflavi]